MCTKKEYENLEGKTIKKVLWESDCGGEFIYIEFTDGFSFNITPPENNKFYFGGSGLHMDDTIQGG